MTAPETHKSSGMGKDLIVYFCILALAGIQFFIAYQDISSGRGLRKAQYQGDTRDEAPSVRNIHRRFPPSRSYYRSTILQVSQSKEVTHN